jgi:hypothetical protein
MTSPIQLPNGVPPTTPLPPPTLPSDALTTVLKRATADAVKPAAFATDGVGINISQTS